MRSASADTSLAAVMSPLHQAPELARFARRPSSSASSAASSSARLSYFTADVWSFGWTLVEIWTSQVPFARVHLRAVSDWMQFLAALTQAELMAHIPPLPVSTPIDVSDVIRACLEVDPKRRPTMEQVRDWLLALNPAAYKTLEMRAAELPVLRAQLDALRPLWIEYDRLARTFIWGERLSVSWQGSRDLFDAVFFIAQDEERRPAAQGRGDAAAASLLPDSAGSEPMAPSERLRQHLAEEKSELNFLPDSDGTNGAHSARPHAAERLRAAQQNTRRSLSPRIHGERV